MRQSVSDHWLAFNKPLEGRVNFMYLDTKGFVSTGVGNLIDATRREKSAPTGAERTASLRMAGQLDWLVGQGGPSATPEQVAEAWDMVKGRMDLASHGGGAFRNVTSLRITDEEIDRFVFVKLADFERHLKTRKEFASFDDWPADAQLGLLSMAWAMGPGFRFPDFQGYVAAGDWEMAATECRFNPESGTIVKRNDLNQQLFRNAARVVAEGLDPEVLLLTAGDMPRQPEPESEPDSEPELELEREPEPEPWSQPDVDTAEGLFAALELLGVTPDGTDEMSLAAAVDLLRTNLGLEPTGEFEVTEDARAFVRDQLAEVLTR